MATTLTSPTGARKASEGFTLVELVIVLAVVAVVLAMALPRLDLGGPEAELKSAARRLAAAVRLARSEAVTRAVPAEMFIWPDAGLIRVVAADEEVFRDELSGRSGSPIAKVSVRERPEEAVIVCRPDGRVSEAVIYLRQGRIRLTVHVEPFLGRVETQTGWASYDWLRG